MLNTKRIRGFRFSIFAGPVLIGVMMVSVVALSWSAAKTWAKGCTDCACDPCLDEPGCCPSPDFKCCTDVGRYCCGSDDQYCNGGTCAYYPELESAVSRKTHGGVGDLDISLPLSSTPGVETRAGGPTKLILTFNKAVSAIDEDLTDLDEVSVSAGTVASVSIDDDEMTVILVDVPIPTCLTVEVTGLEDENGEELIGDDDFDILVLTGDVDADSDVDDVETTGDIDRIGDEAGTTSSSTAKYDIDYDGTIDWYDQVIAYYYLCMTGSCE